MQHSFQEILRKLTLFWEKQGCVVHQGYDLEMGAGTFNPATFLRCIGPEPYKACYIEPCRRPTDGRYGENPNRTQHYFQYQVILKPPPENVLDLYLQSLEAIGFTLKEHDIRFVHDDWEAPTLAAYGLGWEVWMNGMEVTQFTYFQGVGSLPLNPITAEITYGLERLALYLQEKNSFFDLAWNSDLTYGDIYHQNEVEFSQFNFLEADTSMWARHFDDFEKQAAHLMEKNLPLPAYDFVMKASHAFNILDARGAISVTERAGYIGRIRNLAREIASSYLKKRESLGFPLLKEKPSEKTPEKPMQECVAEGKTFDFLLEIGFEEMPAAFCQGVKRSFQTIIQTFFKEKNISYSSLQIYSSPRRLALILKGVPSQTESLAEEKRGPRASLAFLEDGALSEIGTKFFASLGLHPKNKEEALAFSEIEIREEKKQPTLFVKKKGEQQNTLSLLQKHFPELILSIDFPKRMHWDSSMITFGRPIRWIAALYDKHILPMTVGALATSRISWGHRQLSLKKISLKNVETYLSTLKEHHVLVDQDERKEHLLKELARLDVDLIEKERVLEEVLYLSEHPMPLIGTFDKSFLSLPKEVLVSEMIEHQKYFPIEKEGRIQNRFVLIADNEPSPCIIQGNEKVLSARLHDGAFLYEQSIKKPLPEYLEALKTVVFQKSLGSLHQKSERLAALFESIAKDLNISTSESLKQAALFAKADLVSEMVFEFPELQGIIGSYIAKNQGFDPKACLAIQEHYMPLREQAPLPTSQPGALISISDKFDNIVGCFLAGLKPTSSQDPNALRRQAFGIIKILIDQKWSLSLSKTIQTTCSLYKKDLQDETLSSIVSFFGTRLKSVLLDLGFLKDEIEAALSVSMDDLFAAYLKVKALHAFRKTEDFNHLFEVYKRAKGQLNGVEHLTVDTSLLQEPSEIALFKELDTVSTQIQEHLSKQNFKSAYASIASLNKPLNRFFDEVKILSENKSVKDTRIALLQRVFSLFEPLVDFQAINRS